MADKTVTVAPSGGTYANLAAAIAGELVANANLVTMAGILHIKIEGNWSGAPDTTAVTINNFTTSAAYYVHIYTDSANRAKASALDTTRYILDVDNASAILGYDDYIWIDGLQVRVDAINAATCHCIYFASISATNNHLRVSNCRTVGAGDAVYSQSGIYVGDTDAIATLWNNIGYNFSPTIGGSSAIRLNCASANVYNCAGYGNRIGVYRQVGTVNVYDSVMFNNFDDFDGTFNTIGYCSSDDNDGTNNVAESGGGASWTNDFTDAANGDFTLKATSALVGAGGMAGSGTFSDDIAGTTRGAAWDVGPYEYVATGGDVEVPITGVSGTASVGALALSAALALTGLAGTAAVGDLCSTQAISGIEAPASAGSMSPAMAAVLAGIEAVDAAGGMAVDITFPLTGVSANPAYPIDGVQATGAVGIVAAGTGVGTDITIPITGVSANPSYPLSGVAAAGVVGNVSPVEVSDLILPITGVGADGAVGDVTYLTMGGEAMTGEVGSAVPNISPPLTGAEGTGAVGGLTPDISVGLSGEAGTGVAGGFYNTLSPLTGETATGAVGTLVPVVTLGITQVEGKGSVLPAVYNEPDIFFVQYHDAPLSGAFGTGIVGYVYSFVEGDVVVAIAGISVTASVGELTCGVATPTYINVKPRKRILDVPPRQRIIDVHRRRS